MIWSDPIVDEVRRARDAYAARFSYDLWAIFRDLKEQEKRSGNKLVSYAKDDVDAGLVHAPPTTAAVAAQSITSQQAGATTEP